MTRRPVLHTVGNAHLDAVWLWPWEEGFAEVRATFRSALERMDEDPDVTFACDSVAYYAWIEEHDPELFARIRRRVAEGRWELSGGWWVEPDLNAPCGESLVRQGLYGQRWLLERFGRIARVGMNVDPFGHPATLPQILRGQGLEAYVFFRPIAPELSLPDDAFRWESPDGSFVSAYRLPHEYSSGVGVGDMTEHVVAARAAKPRAGGDLMVFFGVGDHGGGPTREAIASIRRLAAAGQDAEIRFSTPERFFERVSEADGSRRMPVVRDELQHHAVGCYSAHSAIKALNRRTETALLAAERWSTVATVVFGTPYPLASLGHAWRQLAFNQFHDILAGTAIAAAYETARDQVGEALAIAGRASNLAVQALAARIDTDLGPETRPVVVVNRLAWPVDAVVEVDLGEVDGPLDVLDADRSPIPAQVEPSGAVVARRARVVLPVQVPALGYRLVGIRAAGVVGPSAEDPQAARTPAVAVHAGERFIVAESDRLRAVVDRTTGWLAELTDRVTDTTLTVPDGARHAVVLDDPGDTWAHGVARFENEVGTFMPLGVRVESAGPVRAVVRIESAFGSSTLVEDLELDVGAAMLEIRVSLDWQERRRVLKLRAPVDLEAPLATFSVPFGHVERPARGGEEPGQAWVDVTGRLSGGAPAGLAVVCDAKGAWDIDGASIGITAARSPAFAWHDPAPLDADRPVAYQDQGRQRFRYALLPHAGSWRDAAVPRQAAALLAPPITLLEGTHAGHLPASGSFAALGPSGVELAALKLAEDGSGDVIARLVECHGTGTRAVLELPAIGRRCEVALRPFEVSTLRIPRRSEAPVRQVDLLER